MNKNTKEGEKNYSAEAVDAVGELHQRRTK